MLITDLNPSNDIGANCLLLKMGRFSIIVDSGLHPEKLGNEATPDFSRIEPGSVDFVIVTHCHLDHIGTLPLLAKYQPQAKILTSLPSSMLLKRILHNSCRVMERQSEEFDVPEYPLYTKADIEKVDQRLESVPFIRKQVFKKEDEEIALTFYPAGHIVGAVGFRIEHNGASLFMTGDVSFHDQLTLLGASFPQEPVDLLITETTRGGTERKHSREEELERLLEQINHTIGKKGSCLIPVFALGRMQEMVAVLAKWKKEKRLKPCPVYCSGLGMDLMDYFELIAKETKATRFRKKLLQTLGVRPLPKKKGSLIPVVSREPSIYLVSSGMLVERTPSYGIASQLLESSKNSVCFVGYCDPSTPGGELLRALPGQAFEFKAIDKSVLVNATVRQFDLSGHADRDELLAFVLSCSPKAVYLTHGSEEAQDWFSKALHQHAICVKNP